MAGGGAVAAAQHPQPVRARLPELAVEQGTVGYGRYSVYDYGRVA